MTKPKIVKPAKPAEPQDVTAPLSELAAEAAAPAAENVIPIGIPKPVSILERARSKRGSTIAGVETMLQALPILKIRKPTTGCGCTRMRKISGLMNCVSSTSRS
jgi:hypothetical protein